MDPEDPTGSDPDDGIDGRRLLRLTTAVGVAGLSGCGGLHAWYHGRLFIAEWVQNWIRTVSFDGSVAEGDVADVRPFMPDTTFDSPIAMDIGPGGALYVAEYGGRYGGADSRISKVTRA